MLRLQLLWAGTYSKLYYLHATWHGTYMACRADACLAVPMRNPARENPSKYIGTLACHAWHVNVIVYRRFGENFHVRGARTEVLI